MQVNGWCVQSMIRVKKSLYRTVLDISKKKKSLKRSTRNPRESVKELFDSHVKHRRPRCARVFETEQNGSSSCFVLKTQFNGPKKPFCYRLKYCTSCIRTRIHVLMHVHAHKSTADSQPTSVPYGAIPPPPRHGTHQDVR